MGISELCAPALSALRVLVPVLALSFHALSPLCSVQDGEERQLEGEGEEGGEEGSGGEEAHKDCQCEGSQRGGRPSGGAAKAVHCLQQEWPQLAPGDCSST